MRRRWMLLGGVVLAGLSTGLATPTAQAQSRADSVRLPLPRYDGTLTPYTFELAYPLMTLVYDTVMWRDARGVPRPWLARSVRRSAGGRRVTVTLRRARWHDGRPLTAADVAFTFGFVSQRYHPRFTPQLANLAEARTAGARTVVFELRRPSLGFDDQPLADVPILPRHIWQGLGDGAVPTGLPVGSGPYRLSRARRSSGYVFRANRGYFRGRPRVARIRVPIIRQEERTYNALDRRRVDMLPINLSREAVDRFSGDFGLRLKSGPLYSGAALLLNTRRSPFDSRGVRRRVSRALSLRLIARGAGGAVPADRGYVHPESPWAPDQDLHRDDPDAARDSLAGLNLPPIRILAPESDPAKVEAARQVVLALRRAGARARLSEVPRLALGRAIGEDGASPDFDAAVVETPVLASYDPDFLARVFGSDSRTAPLNYSGYSSSRFDALAERVASAPDRESRRRATAAELRQLAADAPAIPLYFPNGDFAFRSAVYGGWLFVKGSGILDKRSFLPGAASVGGGGGNGATGEEGEDTGTSVLDIVSVVSLIALVAVLGVAAFALVRRRSVERR